MLTSGDQQGQISQCEQLGVSAYLMKPVKPTELLDAMLLARDPIAADARLFETTIAMIQPTSKRLNIFLAEDSLVNQKLAIGLLTRQGHRVHVANNGREAVAATIEETFDLILMDIQMPIMDGIEAAQTIRARDGGSRHHVPIIAMTAHAMKGDREMCLEAGMDGYIAKSIRSDLLFETINIVLTEVGQQNVRVTTATSQVIDWSHALDVVDQDQDLLVDLEQTLLEETPKQLNEIRNALPVADHKVIQLAANTIKGALRCFGAAVSMETAYELELAAKKSQLHDVPRLLETLVQQVEGVSESLAQFVSDGTMA